MAPFELPQVIAQIPPPPVNVPMSIRKALLVDGESKAVNYLVHGEYELNKTSSSNYRKNIMLAGTKSMLLSKEKEDPEVPNISKEESKQLNPR